MNSYFVLNFIALTISSVVIEILAIQLLQKLLLPLQAILIWFIVLFPVFSTLSIVSIWFITIKYFVDHKIKEGDV